MDWESYTFEGDSRIKRRFSEKQIVGLLKRHEAGAALAQLCREHNVSDATFYRWKSKFGGIDAAEAKRLKQLEEENGKFKKLLAKAVMDHAALKDLLTKCW